MALADSSPASPSFDFLRSTYPVLRHLAATAEKYCELDPQAALSKLRLFGECLAKEIARTTSVGLQATTQIDRLQELGSAGLLPQTISRLFHTLRRDGNSAVHTGRASIDDARRAIEVTFELARWFRASFAPELIEPPASYKAPLAEKDIVETLRVQVDALRQVITERPETTAEIDPVELASEVHRLLQPHRDRYDSEIRELRREIERLETLRLTSANRIQTPPEVPPPKEVPISSGVPQITGTEAGGICPRPGCGAELMRAVATRDASKHGVRRGDAILRCSRYPKCTGWMPDTGPAPAPAKPSHATWIDTGTRDGWDITYLSCGGRLRAMSLPADVTEAERRALVQAAVFVRNDLGNSTGENADGRRLVTNLFRRMLGRGTMPPVDPLIETHILESVGLGAEARAAAHPGDLARTIDQKKIPSVETVRAALRHRHEFVPDSRLKRYDGSPVLSEPAMQFFERELAGLSASAGQWCHPGRVGPGTTLDAMDLDSVLLETPDISAVLTQREPESRVRTLGRMEAFIRAGGTADEYTMKLVWAPIAAHRIALGVAEAAERGWLNGERWTFVIDEPTGIASVALQSAVEVLGAISSIWNVPMLPQEVRLIVGNQANVWRAEAEGRFVPAAVQEAIDPHDAVTLRIELFRGPYHELPADAGPCVVIRSTCLPVQLIDDRLLGASRARVDSAASVPRWALVRLLRAVFAKADFQPDGPHPRGQEAAIRRLLAGDDTVVLLPTGAGKSLIYQFAGLLLPGLTLVVDPIVALIDDQVDGLNRQGIDRALGITSADRVEGSADAKLKRIAAGEALFAFVAPERLQQRRFRETLRTMTATTPIALVVVDEAHCVSEWGHDFRTSYLDIGRVLRHVAADVEGLSPPLLALTGTASRAVLKDMLIELGVDRADPGIVISPASFDRSELRFAVVHADDDEPLARLIGTVRGLPSRFRESGVPRALGEFLRPRGAATASGVIFCQTVDGRYGVKRTAKLLEANLNIEVATYSGKPDGGAGAKRNNARRFKENEAPLMVATKAYGMGVDKPNIRYAIHVGIPSSIENYYQEIGRAGRDRRESACILVHFPDARNTLDYFHQKTYAGVESEVASLAGVIAALPELGELTECIIPFHGDGAASRERAIHRLKLLGIVRDYTVDWAGSRFEVKTRPCAPADVDLALAAFVRRNQPGRVAEFERRMAADAPAALQPRVLSRGRMMIDYVYETIVAARRRAVDEMERLAEQGTTEQLIRDRILRYLELGKVASAVEALIDAEPFEFEPWIALLDDLETMDDAREWRGATARLLESDPDNPGLLLGRGLAEASAEGDVELFKRSLAHALDTASRKYSVSHRSIARTVAWAAHWLGRRAPTLRPLIYGIVDTALPGTSDELLDPLELQALGSANIERAELSIVLDRRLRKVADYAKTAANRLTITPS